MEKNCLHLVCYAAVVLPQFSWVLFSVLLFCAMSGCVILGLHDNVSVSACHEIQEIWANAHETRHSISL